MSSLHIHLLLNHAPAIGFMFGGFLLLIANLRNNRLAGSVALIVFIICGATSFVVFQAGEGAENIVEHMENFSHSAIKWHEHTARPALWAAIVAALWSAFVLFLEVHQFSRINL